MAEEQEEDQQEYLYKSAGIRERHGRIPLWLLLVAAALLIWSLYYMIQFWNSG
jgi:hypothetical protein